MPQMMPINWIFSLIFFISIFMIFNIMNYFIFYYKNNKMKKHINHKNNFIYWKW
uniref:ATP synthase complex subunit 8 n=1 Tax=Argynnis sagana TaxID=525816 RepID=A0A343TAT4_9NEOP|nr:ATP synthase F0 subunit 8 [Argynnis sagana]AUW36016.1 ATP synthase FO subunit 8 [Argynnis sagana]